MFSNKHPCEQIKAATGLDIFFAGPSLSKGPLPAIIYFTSTAQESLTLDPYNQPVQCLAEDSIRIFSFTLPGHGEGTPNANMMSVWAESMELGQDIVGDFVRKAKQNIDYLVGQGYIDPNHLAVSGLSRGGFLATHLAAHDERIKTVLGFAPLTSFEVLEEFRAIAGQPFVQALDLRSIADKLVHKRLRFYVGNRDLRVSTEACFRFIMQLTETAYQNGVRSPHVELIIGPSIGHKGHGTAPHIFAEGINWIKQNL
jgi:pimeloyl-ACP methyl ester carboxylesterase